jgi:hypothetical protein
VDLRGAKIDAKGYDGSPQAAIARGSVLFRKVLNFGHGLELRISIDEINVMAVSFPCCMEPVRGGKAAVRKTRSSPSSLKVTTGVPDRCRERPGNGVALAATSFTDTFVAHADHELDLGGLGRHRRPSTARYP